MSLYYAALDGYGRPLGVARDANAAVSIALECQPQSTVAVQELDPDDLRPNATPAEKMPAIAFSSCRIEKISHTSVQAMSLEEAHRRLLPYFEGLMKRGAPTTLYRDKLLMADAWIGQNYKTGKEHPGQPSKVMGLTLVPASHPRLAALGEGPYSHLLSPLQTPERRAEGISMIRRWASELPISPTDRKFTFCQGSNQNCRDSCLVFAGQNASELYNTYRKVAQAMALLSEPVAFARMLVESLERWLRSREIQNGVVPYVRLNVLSDIPWELVAPWLFERFHRLQFYDYTKVPGRKAPRNYDLTFSVSGTNFEWAQEEINQRERRVAVVFIGHKKRGASWAPVKLKGPRLLAEVPLPQTFWGLPVVDGDISDVRPLDPAPSCVGLRWKTPSGKRAGVTVDPTKSSFVTPVYIVSSNELARYRAHAGGVTQSWKGEEPNPAREQWLIAPVTPRYQPIDHDVAQAEG